MEKLENLISIAKLNNLLNKHEEESKCECSKKKTACCVLAVVGVVVLVAVLAYGLYKYLKPDYLEEFEDDEFEDEDFDEDFLLDEEE